jgi:glycosyltransferase involved in cell wall biosynthesis
MGPYVRHGVDALTVPPADSGALRAAIDKAVADGELRRRLGAAARAAVEQRFTAAAMWGTIRELAVGPA